jgi:hypothetical protein
VNVKHRRLIHSAGKDTIGMSQLYKKGGKFQIFNLLWCKAANISGSEKKLTVNKIVTIY